jgi:Lon protease-like protein
MSEREEHFIFPLGTVLYPGGALPLRIFEQRYIEMTKACLRDNRPFGVCLIREGREVGTPAVPECIGCLASIESWEMPQVGMFHLIARGGDRFRLHDTQVAPNGLVSGSISRMPTDTGGAVDSICRDVLKALIRHVGEAQFPQPILLDDADWVSYRLAEILPVDMHVKQALLETDDAASRFERLRQVLLEQRLIEPNEPNV